MTEHPHKGGAHDATSPTISSEEAGPQALSDFELSLSPEEHEMFFEYKEIFDLLQCVVEHTVSHAINYEKEIIAIAEIFHRLNIPIVGIMKEFREKHTADGLANIYRLERITGDDSSATITELEKKCRDILGQARYFPTSWGSSEYEGVELVAAVIDWKIKSRDFFGAQELVLRIPRPGQNIDLISRAFTNSDYFFEGYYACARALITAGHNPLQGIESCDAQQVRTMLTATVQGYLDRGDWEKAKNVCDIQKKWCADLRESAQSPTLQYDGITRIWETRELHDAQEDASKFFYEQRAFLHSIHAVALKKHEKGIDCSDEVRQSTETLRDIEGQVRDENPEGRATLAYSVQEALLTYARLGFVSEAQAAIPIMHEYSQWFCAENIPPFALVYAALGDVNEAKVYVHQSNPRAIRIVAEQAFQCGQDAAGNYFAALLANMCTRERNRKAEYNSYPVKVLKEYSRLRMFMSKRKGKRHTLSVADYEYMVENNINDETSDDKAEDVALEHISAALADIDSWHPSLSVDQKKKVRSGAVAALQKSQKDDVVVPSLTKLRRSFEEKADLWRFVRFTGVTLEPALVQAAYGKILEARQHIVDIEAMLKEIKDIQDATHILFDGKQYVPALEKSYRSLLEYIVKGDAWQGSAHFLDCVKSLTDFTGISPSPTLVSEFFGQILFGQHGGATLWALLDHFKNTPLVWNEIDPEADSEIYESTRKMSSNDLQKKMWSILARARRCIPRQFDNKGWSGDFDRSHYSSMPPYIYGVWVDMVGGPIFGDWFLRAVNDAYTKIGVDIGKKKPGSRAVLDRLTYGIIESQHLDLDMGRFLGDLNTFVDRGIVPKELSDLVYSYALVSQLYVSMNLEGLSPAGEIREGRNQKKEFTGSVSEYIGQLERQAGQLFGEFMGIEGQSYEQVIQLKEKWGSFDVLFTLASKYAKGYEVGLPLFRAMLSAELENRWHAYRYDETDPVVARQVEGCTPEEKNGWIENSPAQKLSDVALEAINTHDIAKGIRGQLSTASWGHHIYPLEHEGIEGHLFEKTIHHLLLTDALQAHNVPVMKIAVRSLIYERKTLPSILGKLCVVLGVRDKGFDAEFSAALEHEITALSAVDPKALTRAQKTLLGHLNVARDWLTASHILKTVDFDTLGISDASSIDDLDEIYKALETTELLLRLRMISAKDIESGELPPFVLDAGRPDPLSSSIEKLIKIFDGRKSPFVQDLKNIQVLLSQRFAVGSVEHLALTIRESDDLKESLESGKFPTGASSCQNYESEAHYTKCLLARAGDLDKKNIIIQKEDGTIVVENELKLVYVDDKIPAIFIEPTNYSSIRERYDVTHDVERYAKAKARRMSSRIKVLRGTDEVGAGAILVTVRPSRNHFQFEDGKHGGPGHGGLGIKEGEYTMWAVEVA
ncbi:hypothetical protein HY732_01705 [Candidatus Uhrbacteria bacterium]|nr:hypothetical protein [Candidatus Uhrbacteria bacterium]